MKIRLSGLMDGELAEHDTQVLFDALKRDDGLRGSWREYQLIRDTLKGERNLDTELTARVMAALEEEPTVLAPQIPARRNDWHRSVLALAATLAGVAVVGWMALNTGQSPQSAARSHLTVAQLQPASGGGVQPVRQASRDMQQYLIAHEAQSSSLQFRGGTEHIRTVAAIGVATSK